MIQALKERPSLWNTSLAVDKSAITSKAKHFLFLLPQFMVFFIFAPIYVVYNASPPRCICDRRERDKLQETLPSVTRFKQPVSQRATCVATKLQDELQEKLPSVTAP